MGLGNWIIDAIKGRQPTEQDRRVAAAIVRVGEEVSHHVTTPTNEVDYGRVGRALNGSVWNAASIMAQACASHQLRLYRDSRGMQVGKARKVSERTKSFLRRGHSGLAPSTKAMAMAEATESIEEVTEHPALDLLADPDPHTSASLFLTMLYWYREVSGKCYIYAGEESGDQPTGLYILHPQYTQVQLSKESLIESYKYGRDVTDYITIPAERVVRSVYMVDPFRPWDGVSWTRSIEQYADAESAALTAEIARWRNSGMPGMIFSVPMEYTDEQIQQAQAAMKNRSGPLAAGRSLIMRDATIVQAAAKPNEMGYEAGLKQAEAAIYRACGIPEAIWKLNDANLAGAEMGIELLDRAAWGRMKRVAEDLTEWLLPMFGIEPGEMWFGYESPVQENIDADAARLLAGFNARAVTVNEYRKALSLKPVEESLDTLGPSMPTGLVGGGVEPLPNQPNQPTPETVQEPVTSPALDKDQTASIMQLATAAKAGELPVDTAIAIAAASFPALTPQQIEAVFGPIRKTDPQPAPVPVVEPATKAYGCTCERCYTTKATLSNNEQKLQAVAEKWLKDALERGVQGVSASGEIDLNILAPDELQKALEPLMKEIFRQGAEEFMQRRGVEAEPLSTKEAEAFVQQYTADLVKDVADTTKQSIKDAVSRGIEQGQTLNEIQQGIKDNSGEISLSRAETIARTETARAYQSGSLEQAAELGWGGKSWLLSGNPCGLCEGANAAISKPVPIREPFFKVGDTIAGTDGKTYTISREVMVASDLHPNCSCGTLEVLELGGEQ